MQGHKEALISLAILKSDLDDERRDYLSYLESFLIPILRDWGSNPVTDTEVAEKFLKEHGLRIPDRAVQLVLRRLAKQGYLEKSHGVFAIAREIPNNNLNTKKSAAREHMNAVVDEFVRFVNEKYDVNWKEDDAIQALISFLNKFGIDCIRVYVFRSTLPTVDESEHKSDFLVGAFVKNIYESKKSLFESFIVLVKGQMYANALTCPDLESIGRDFKNVTFYFDTPLLLNLLNLQGSQEFESIAELISLIKRLNGKIAVFSHTASELEIVLSATSDNIENTQALGRVVREVRKLGFKKGDIILKRESYQDEFKSYGIRIVKTPDYDKSYQISESDLESLIKNQISYRHQRALEFDINSIRSIFALRKSIVPLRLEDAGAVFVTNNTALSSAAYEFGKTHNSAREVSSVITDFSLANVAWLKSPMDAPSLPVVETLAACYAAIEPEAKLWEKYLHVLDELDSKGNLSADHHAILRVSEVAQSALMDLTLGDERNLRGDTISNILERVKGSLAEEHNVIIEKERQEHNATKVTLRSVQERERKLGNRIDRISMLIAKLVYLFLFSALCITLFFGALASSGYVPSFVFGSRIATAITNTIVIITISWGVYSNIVGTPVKSYVNSYKRKIARTLSDRIKALLIVSE